MDRTSDPLVLLHEREGSPIRDIAVGRVYVTQFRQSSQLEKNFAKSLFTVLCYVKRNIDWSVGGKPPVDRDAYDALMQCCDFEPFQKYWSRGKKMRAVGYKNTVNLDSQAQMLHRLQRERPPPLYRNCKLKLV